jgi:hypothetical protein
MRVFKIRSCVGNRTAASGYGAAIGVSLWRSPPLFDLFSISPGGLAPRALSHGLLTREKRKETNMRMMILLLAVFYSAAAIAQDKPPADPAKPAAQAKAKSAAKPRAAPAKPQSIAAKLQACLEIDDATKERLNCYDAVFPPTPKPKAPAAKAVTECRFIKEEDERLTCFNGFAEKIPKLPN